MARLAAIDPRTTEGTTRDLLDGPLQNQHFNMVRSMAQSPAALQMLAAMQAAIKQCTLGEIERSLVQLVVSEAIQCGYSTAANVAFTRIAGASEAAITDSRRGCATDPRHQALVTFALAVHEKHGLVSDSDVLRFESAGFTRAHIAEVVALHALATFTSTFNRMNETKLDFPAVERL